MFYHHRRFISLLTIGMLISVSPLYAVEWRGVEVHGFASQGYLKSDTNNYLADSEDGSFQFNEFGINVSKELMESLRAGIQLFARDLGTVGNNQVELDWAYGDYHWRDWLGLRVGLMKMAHGLYNETRDIDLLRTSILLPQSVYNDTTRDYYTRMWGGEIYGEISLEKLGSFSYRGLIGTYTPDAENSGLTKYIADQAPTEIYDFDNGMQYNGSLQWHTPLQGLRLGVTSWLQNDFTAYGRFNAPFSPWVPAGTPFAVEIENRATVYSIEYVWDNLVLTAEYRNRETTTAAGAFRPEETTDSDGYYASASYRFTDWFELGAYYSEFYRDTDDKDGERFRAVGLPNYLAWQKDLAVTTRFDFDDYWLLKLEAHKMNGVGDLFIKDNPDGFEEDWWLFAVKVTFNF